jgi:hypothetical protein
MIAAHLEPKGLSPDAEALPCDYPLVSKEEAERGSRRLLEAIFRTVGLDAPPVVEKPKPPQLKLITREAAHIPSACPFCGAPEKPQHALIAHIQHTVASYYGLEPITMKSARRSLDISRPRQVAMYLSAKLTPRSLPEIGRRFGGRDHTTVLHAIRAVEKRMAQDVEVMLDVEVLRERLGG